MVKNLPANAGDASWIPGCGTKIPHTVEQLSPRTTREALHQGKILSATAMTQAVAVLSCSVVSDSLRPHRLQPARLLCPWNSLGKNNTGVGHHAHLQGIFPTQGSNWGLPYCRFHIPFFTIWATREAQGSQQQNKTKNYAKRKETNLYKAPIIWEAFHISLNPDNNLEVWNHYQTL